MRRKPSDHSEMVSQMLFGECFKILGRHGKIWIKVSSLVDDFTGWIDPYQCTFLTSSECTAHLAKIGYSLDLIQSVMAKDHAIPISIGASLPCFDGMSFKILKEKYNLTGMTIVPSQTQISFDLLIKIARKFIHTPYLLGGRSPMGIDAPGLVQLVFKMAGVALRRDASSQSLQGEVVDFLEYSRVGDVAFFADSSNHVFHCGIILENREIMHAFSKVRIDQLDHHGIYNKDLSKYTHKLRIIKRFISL